jgi:flagellar protein FlbD
MIKLTRLNNHTVAINPDHISWADATPDTTLALIAGEKIIVRESLDDLVALVVEFRRLVRATPMPTEPEDALVGDPPRVTVSPRRTHSEPPARASLIPLIRREGR